MRVFVAFGYNDRDKWVRELVFPLINAFQIDVVTGEDLQGLPITAGVGERIAKADGLLAFVTRRGTAPMSNGMWDTHRWVTDEIAYALAQKVPVVELRETGVEDQGGIAGDRQRITYDEGARDRCLVELASVLGRWSAQKPIRLKLLPEAFVADVAPNLNKTGAVTCSYEFLDEHLNEVEGGQGQIRKIEQGLFLTVRSVPKRALIQIRVNCNGRSWASPYVSPDSVAIELQ